MVVTFLQFMLGVKVEINLSTHFEKEPILIYESTDDYALLLQFFSHFHKLSNNLFLYFYASNSRSLKDFPGLPRRLWLLAMTIPESLPLNFLHRHCCNEGAGSLSLNFQSSSLRAKRGNPVLS
jgi:hypothetical protein